MMPTMNYWLIVAVTVLNLNNGFLNNIQKHLLRNELANNWRTPSERRRISISVSLRRSYNDQHFCGGTIITSINVITAAHCMFYRWGGALPPILVKVIAGQLGLPLANSSIYRGVKTIISHEDFNLFTLANDIAILELDGALPIDNNPLISSIPLSERSSTLGNCFISGWGVEEHESENVSDILLVAKVGIILFKVCEEMYASESIALSDGMLCAGNNGNQDACQGDSGGPLVCNGALTGIISTGNGCGDTNYPGIYTSIEWFLPWIDDKLRETTEITYEASLASVTVPFVETNNLHIISSTIKPKQKPYYVYSNSASISFDLIYFVFVAIIFS